MTRPTIRDVAKQAGVGIGTVSRVLNNSPRVDPATRLRVLEVITALGFRPNSIARQLPRKTRIHNLGVITQPFVTYQAFAERLRGVQNALSDIESDHELVLYTVSSPQHYAERLETIVQSSVVEGLIIIDLDLFEDQEKALNAVRLPFVGLNHFRNRTWPCVGTDNIEGGTLATRHLLDYGHTRIAYVGDDFVSAHQFMTSQERFQGFTRAMIERQTTIRGEYIKLGSHNYEVARGLAAELFTLPEPPTAIFAMSDMQALACIRAAREAGRRVPEDVSVIGYDDLDVAQHTGLTTVLQHLELSGRLAVQHLLQLLKGGNVPDPPPLPPLEVMVRQTTQRV